MREPTKTTKKNFADRLVKLGSVVLENPSAEFFEAFDRFLDELGDEDFFGTERQNDPRGDMRG